VRSALCALVCVRVLTCKGKIQCSFFCASGTEAIEGAMKLAKLYTGKSGTSFALCASLCALRAVCASRCVRFALCTLRAVFASRCVRFALCALRAVFASRLWRAAFICAVNGFHGKTMGSLSLIGKKDYRERMGTHTRTQRRG
jgi:acetylornithine/succinyldiaminopimelate/putrescine aminotransferase